jgi:hypothetical protein
MVEVPMRSARKLVGMLALAGSALLWSPTQAAAGEAKEPSAEQAPPKRGAEPAPKWVVQSIEVSTKKSNPFGGRVILQRVPGKATDLLSYYWGGKCRKTKVPPSRLALLTKAMVEGYAVQIPAFPIKYGNSVIMCMQSIRVSKQ